jgi:hypothetical protein
VIVVLSWLFNGVDASGVSVIVSVVDCPGVSVTGLGPATVSPLDVDADSVTLSAWFPTLLIFSAVKPATPGVVFTIAGLLVNATASTAGIVNVSVCVSVIAGLVALVAVTVKTTCVPAAGT